MGILGDILKIAAGVAIGNSSSVNEEKKQTQLMKEQAIREKQQVAEARHQAALESQRQWRAVKKANEERRRKGLPELPYPPRTWY